MHRRLIGEAVGPVVLSPATVGAVVQQAVPGIDPALVASVPEVRFTVPEAKPLETARDRMPDLLRTGAVVALALVALSFVIHPRRDRLLVRVGWWLLAASVAQVFLLYLVPVVLAPAVVDNVWTGLVLLGTAAFFGVWTWLRPMLPARPTETGTFPLASAGGQGTVPPAAGTAAAKIGHDD